MTHSISRAPWVLNTLSICAFLSHIICCVFPLILVLLSTAAAGSVSINHLFHHPLYQFVHQYHVWILSFAVLSVSLSVFLLWKNKHTSKVVKVLTIVSFILLLFDIGFFFFEENFFHIEHVNFVH